MTRPKLFFIFFFIAISFSFFIIKANAQCNTNCGDCDTQTKCAESLAPTDGCEWNPGSILPPTPAQCQPCSRITEVFWPDSPFGTHLGGCSTLTILVKYVYEWGIFFGGIAAFFAFVVGGFLYLTSAGDPSKMREGRDRIFTAIIGLILLLSVYLILNTINPELTLLTIPSSGIGSPCDIDTDCCVNPTNCPFKCDDLNQGDGNKEGYCLLDVQSGCDTVADCPANYECKNDPNPGDGTKEGMCFPICNQVILRTDTAEVITISGVTSCSTASLPKIIKSVEAGGCLASLYPDTTDCNAADVTKRVLLISGSKSIEITDPIQSVKVEKSSF